MFSEKDLNKLIFPLVIEQILSVLMGMADIIMVASCSEAAVSGVSLIDSINILLLQIFAALATGGAVVVSQFIGKEDIESANNSAKQLIVVTLILASLISLGCVVYRSNIINLIFGTLDSEVYASANTYFLITALSYPFISIFNAIAALFRSMGDSKISMKCSFFMNLLNIICNAIFIYVFNWGVMGAATATTLSRIIGSFIMMNAIKNQNNLIYIDSIKKFRFKLDIIKKILVIGIPSGLENGMFHIGKLLTAGLITSLGTTAITANAVANNFSSMASIPEMAIDLALISVVGRCIGAREEEQAKSYTVKLMKKMWIQMIVLNAVIFLLAPYLLNIYSLSLPTKTLALTLIRMYCIGAVLFVPLAFGLPNALRAAGDVKFTMTSSIASMWLFRIGLSYLFVLYFNMGLPGVWIAMICDWAIRALLTFLRFRSNKWLKKALV